MLSHLQSLFNRDREAMSQRRRSYVAFIHLSNGERAVAKSLQKLSRLPPLPLQFWRCCIRSGSFSSSWTLDYHLNNSWSARWKRGLRLREVIVIIIFLSTRWTLFNLSNCLEIFLSGVDFNAEKISLVRYNSAGKNNFHFLKMYGRAERGEWQWCRRI